MLDTVNVIEMHADMIISLRSFTDDDEGNKKAENLFENLVKENGGDLDEIEGMKDEGYFNNGDYSLLIFHSIK